MPPKLKPEPLVVGVSLIALGALWTLGNLGRLDMLSTVRTWWPSILVIWGLLELYDSVFLRARSATESGPDATRAAEPDTES
jgi:hypothetical protein